MSGAVIMQETSATMNREIGTTESTKQERP